MFVNDTPSGPSGLGDLTTSYLYDEFGALTTTQTAEVVPEVSRPGVSASRGPGSFAATGAPARACPDAARSQTETLPAVVALPCPEPGAEVRVLGGSVSRAYDDQATSRL